ncbi:MAG: hypothetical protein PHF60_00590 [Candidatus ainarchaeum sp.]|nr:hypothetical protein [Candidatus ainarchaeum sp.]
MRRFIPLILLVFAFGCAQKPPEPPEQSYSTYTDGLFSFDAPEWQEAAPGPGMFFARSNGTCMLVAATSPIPSALLRDELKKSFGENLSSAEGEYLDYTFVMSGNTYNGRSRVMYCDYQTYSLTMACLGPVTETRPLDSAACAKRQLETKPKLGLIANPPNDDTLLIVQTIKDARQNGVDVLYWYFSYDASDDWTSADYIMEPLSYEGRTGVVMEAIHTTVLAPYPEGFMSLDSPGFKEAYAERSVEFVERYHPDYYFVGNEVDVYLSPHRDQVPAFKELLRYTREKVHAASPSTKVGFTVTYHDALRNNATDIIETLAEDADLIGYTSYGYGEPFRFDNVSAGAAYIRDIRNLVPGKPYAIVETGWSSSSMLGSSEDKQAEFAGEFFSYLGETDAEFINWFELHDGKDCTAAAEGFLVDAPELKENEEFMEIFKESLCTLGMKYNDDTPKKAWDVWLENT